MIWNTPSAIPPCEAKYGQRDSAHVSSLLGAGGGPPTPPRGLLQRGASYPTGVGRRSRALKIRGGLPEKGCLAATLRPYVGRGLGLSWSTPVAARRLGLYLRARPRRRVHHHAPHSGTWHPLACASAHGLLGNPPLAGGLTSGGRRRCRGRRGDAEAVKFLCFCQCRRLI